MKKIYNISLFITSIFVYIVWSLTNTIDLTFLNNFILSKILILITDFILAYGFFHFSANIFILLSSKNPQIKKRILGLSYMKGLWVGYYNIVVDGEIKIAFFKEIMAQSLGGITITGESCYENRKSRAFWYSDGIVEVNTIKKSLVFIYNLDISLDTSKTNTQNLGVEYLHLQYDKGNFPVKYKGYSLNLGDADVQNIFAIKLNNSPADIDNQIWFDKAKSFYENSNL